jgi:hypothetical protein
VAERALRFALSISPDVLAFHVDADDADHEELLMDWHNFVEKPLQAKNAPVPQLRLIRSPFRRFIRPVLAEIKKIRKEQPDRVIAVIIPEVVEPNWFLWPLHNQRAGMLKTSLLFSGEQNVVVINVPWYSAETRDEPAKPDPLNAQDKGGTPK